MSLSNDWSTRFPNERLRTVVILVKETWDELVSTKVPDFNPKSNEPHLTQFLRAVLKVKQGGKGLTGHFSAEEPDADANLKTGKLENRRRTDIRYLSDLNDIDLTLEFKKLKPTKTACDRYHGTEGMLRFVNGKYSKDRSMAFMVGLVEGCPNKCMAILKKGISQPASVTRLQTQTTAEGILIHEPSREMAGLASFDTEHGRADVAEGHPNIVLCHLFLLYGASEAADTAAAADI